MHSLVTMLIAAFTVLVAGRCNTRIVDEEYIITQVVKNNTNLPVVLTIYSKRPPKQVSIPVNGSHTDKFSFVGIGSFAPVDSEFMTDSVSVVFDNRSKVVYPNLGPPVSDNCLSKSIYCITNYEQTDISSRHKQYTYNINQADLVKAK